ncbi:hypothetical protein PRIEUP_LOCUS1576 [Pristimantis euphronides]
MHVCTEHGRISEILHRSLTMTKDQNDVTGKILDLALEIIFLLTGEDLLHSKKQNEPSADACQSCLSEGSTEDQSPHKERPHPSPAHEETPEPAETPHSAAQEVPLRCEDVAVFFSVEEWEYMEQHKERYKEAVTENHQLSAVCPCLTDGPVFTKPPESCRSPLGSQECLEDHNRMTTQEVRAPPGERISLPRCKEEEVPVQISSGEHIPTNPPKSCTRPLVSQKWPEEENRMTTQEYQAINGVNILPNRCEEPSPSVIISGPPTSWKVKPDSPNVLIPVHDKNGDKLSILEQNLSNDVHPIAVIVKSETVQSLRPTPKGKTDQPHLFWPEPDGADSTSSSMKYGDGDADLSSVVHECLQCGQSFGTENDLIAHEQCHCSLCKQCFLDKSALVIHQWALHVPNPITKRSQPKPATKEDGPYSCDECKKLFVSRSTFKKHQRIHMGPFSCVVCGKCLTDKTGLIRHQRTHTGEKPFPCSDCGRHFSRRDHLINHQKIHKV